MDGSIKNEKPIYCYELNGEFYKKYLRFKDVKLDLNFNKPDLKRAIKNNLELMGYYWSYSKYDNICLEDSEFDINTPRKVYQYTLDGDFVREWDSITECRKEFPSVLQVCLGKRNHCHKFKFSFDKLKI